MISLQGIKSDTYIVGIMTGTSMDAVDSALVHFYHDAQGKLQFELKAFNSLPLPGDLRKALLHIISENIAISEVSEMNFRLAEIYSQALNELSLSSGFDLKKVDAVAVHGQTVWHTPLRTDNSIGSTLQLGSASALCQLIGIPVVGDFRAADVALGGHGAPLVPVFDYEFLKNRFEDIVVLNIGGMANITYLPAGCTKGQVRAFDTGPGNILIDIAMKEIYGKSFDDFGETADSGAIVESILIELKLIPFITQDPPKSTGRELFNKDLIKLHLDNVKQNKLKPEDLISTLTLFTAWSVAENIRRFELDNFKLIVSGGGSKNKTILKNLSKELVNANIIVSDEAGIPSQAKESICFAYLAYLTLNGLPGNMPSVTGAYSEAKLGVICLP